MADPFYSSADWLATREQALVRDGSRCSVARLLGGDCSETLHVHHLKPRRDYPGLELDIDNLLTVCSAHHPTLEAVRRVLVARSAPKRVRRALPRRAPTRNRCPDPGCTVRFDYADALESHIEAFHPELLAAA